MKCDREARTRALVLGAVAGAMLFGAGAASASITYIVDQTIGGGSVTGQMVTDGATGAITPSDFLSWNLAL